MHGDEGVPVTTEPQVLRNTHSGGIALDQATGDVYLVDKDNARQGESRVLVFRAVGRLTGELRIREAIRFC